MKRIHGNRGCALARAPKVPKTEDARPAGADASWFEWLPDEVVLHILLGVDDARALVAWSRTSRRHHALAADAALWHRLCLAHFGPPVHETPWPHGVDWRWIYRAQAHVARPDGTDVGAVWAECGQCAYWGDVVDGQPHGFGVMVDAAMTPGCGPVRPRAVVASGILSPSHSAGRVRQGHWVRGRMHGDGIERYPTGVAFRGRWEDGKRLAVGTLCYGADGRYEGECERDEPHGHGTRAYASGDRREGVWHYGQPYGEIVETYDNGDVFVGKAQAETICRGTYIWAKGSRYDGEFDHLARSHGRGSKVYASGKRYEGQWHEDLWHGHGSLTFPDGTCYEGDWHMHLARGRGTLTRADGERYEGDWCDGQRHGHGTNTLSDGTYYEGQWRYDNPHGCGSMTYADGTRYEGDWRDGQRHGRGTMMFGTGERYEGQWHRDHRDGHGEITSTDGTRYEGRWRGGKKNGHGCLTFADGSRLSGLWEERARAKTRVDAHRGLRPCVPGDVCSACLALARDALR